MNNEKMCGTLWLQQTEFQCTLEDITPRSNVNRLPESTINCRGLTRSARTAKFELSRQSLLFSLDKSASDWNGERVPVFFRAIDEPKYRLSYYLFFTAMIIMKRRA
jgi:hypothetical protein